jgi:bacterioferritin
MGTGDAKLLKIDTDQVIELLNKALADEWLAYYQYWVGAKVIKGVMKDEVIAELTEHATDELRHADMLVARIMQLDGTPILNPKEWQDKTNCGYAAPTDFNIKPILEQNIKGEQCAIGVYEKIMEVTKNKDNITYQMAFEILKDEVEHEDDLQALFKDLK